MTKRSSTSTYIGLAIAGTLLAGAGTSGGTTNSSYQLKDFKEPRAPRVLSATEARADLLAIPGDLTGPSFFVLDGAFDGFSKTGVSLSEEQRAFRDQVSDRAEQSKLPSEMKDHFREQGREEAANGTITLDYATTWSKNLIEEHDNLTKASETMTNLAKGGGVALPRVVQATDTVLSKVATGVAFGTNDQKIMAQETGARPGSLDALTASIGTIYRSSDILNSMSPTEPNGRTDFPKGATLEGRSDLQEDKYQKRAAMISQRAAAVVAAAKTPMFEERPRSKGIDR